MIAPHLLYRRRLEMDGDDGKQIPATMTAGVARDIAFQKIRSRLHVAKSMPGWTIIAADADTGHIEASQESRWFRFTDDIVIRVSCDVAGTVMVPDDQPIPIKVRQGREI